nr:pentapeptide repeat-containing protein [uncultured Cellulosilyticum sp.]
MDTIFRFKETPKREASAKIQVAGTENKKVQNTGMKKAGNGGAKKAPKKRVESGLNLKNAQKINKNFMYKDLKRSHCYDCDFSESNFDFTSFRGAHFKSCNFYGASFKAAEFVGTNLKKSRFKKARFEDVIFEGVNLDGADFAGAIFRNTIFVGTDVSKAKNLNAISVNIKVYETLPELEMSEELKSAVDEAMMNQYVKASRVLDTKEGKINTLSIMRLLEQFDEKTLIKGFKLMKNKIANDFCTLSYLIKFLAKHEAEGLI